jgi:prepilin-type N-terminal cleavage/methylation domain-containing protein
MSARFSSCGRTEYRTWICGAPFARGFTIVEVLVVIVCMAIAALVVMPEFSASSAQKLTGAASMLVNDLQYAQMQSMAHGDDPRIMVFDTTNSSYFIAATSAPTTPLTNPVGNLPYSVTYGHARAAALNGVTISNLSLGGDSTLSFGQFGEIDQLTAATIQLKCGTMKITVTIEPTSGRATVSNLQ